MKPERCRAVAKDGKPCGATPVPDGGGLCAWHAPAWEERRREWSRRGGHGRSNRRRALKELPPAMTGEEHLATLTRVLRKVESGELAPGPANAIASLARSMNATRELTEVEQRLQALEQAAGTPPKGWTA